MFDTGAPADVFEQTLAAVDYEGFGDRQRAARREDRCLGLGVVPVIEDGGLGGLGGTPGEYSRVVLGPDGIFAYSGSGDLGQGFETMLSHVVADARGVEPNDVTVVRGDTGLIPRGGGTWASRGAILSGNAAATAAGAAADRVRHEVASIFEVEPDGVQL